MPTQPTTLLLLAMAWTLCCLFDGAAHAQTAPEKWRVESSVSSSEASRTAPIVVDLDRDGQLEIVTNMEGPSGWGTYVFNADGTVKEGWPFQFVEEFGAEPADPSSSDGPVVGNVDEDQDLEVVVPCYLNAYIMIVDIDGNLERYYYSGEDFYDGDMNDFKLANLDYDPALELVFADASANEIVARNGDGTMLHGWPVDADYYYHGEPFYVANTAVGDFEFDGLSEVVPGCYWHPGGGPIYSYPFVSFRHDGQMVEGVVENKSLSFGSVTYPVIADLDGDLDSEVIGATSSALQMMTLDGKEYRGPVAAVGVPRPCAVGDLDGDGDLEVVSARQQLKVIDPDLGTGGPSLIAAATAETPYRSFDGVSIGDVTGDGRCEILAWSNYKDDVELMVLHLFDRNLNELEGWPIEFDCGAGPCDGAFLRHTAMADLEGDGTMELIYPEKGDLVVLEFPRQVPGDTPLRVEWGMYGHDATGAFNYHVGREPRQHFLRGDANGDRAVNVADAAMVLTYLFIGYETDCPIAFDIDANGELGLADALQLLGYLFQGGEQPKYPFPNCGARPSDEFLNCFEFECPPSVKQDPVTPRFGTNNGDGGR